MSRSYKKHSFCSNTKCGDKQSDKEDKQRCNRTLRHANRNIAKQIQIDPELELEKNFFKKDELSNTHSWQFRKEGKSLVKPSCPDKSIHWTKEGKMKK